MSDELFRVYFDPSELGPDGYPYVWHRIPNFREGIKHLVREEAGHRCVRCGHPFVVGETSGEWSPCDEECTHGGPVRDVWVRHYTGSGDIVDHREAQWRVLTVHHLNGVKYDCRWWNLVSLCQRCHLTIQAKVHMARRWNRAHSEWFQPYVAGYYASTILGEELSRAEVMRRLEELLELEHTQKSLFEGREFS